MKTIPNPIGEKRKRFAEKQESARKDVERAFGVLQSRWGIVRYPARTWSTKLWEMMIACVIMHNMIIEDERLERLYDQGFPFQDDNVVPEHGGPATFAQFTQFHHQIRDWKTHIQLQNDLVEYMWAHVDNIQMHLFLNVFETI